MSNDQRIKCISAQGNVRAVSVHATDIVQELCKIHKLSGQHAELYGESIIAALLIASYCKQGERINLNIKAEEGFIRQAIVDAYPDGNVRGYILPRADEVVSKDLKDDAAIGPWGRQGIFSVLRTRDKDGRQPFIGHVPLLTGYLAKDLTYYWVQSEQIPSSVGISVTVEGGQIKGAGGFLVQAMPGATDEDLRNIEGAINNYADFQADVCGNPDSKSWLVKIMGHDPFTIVEEKNLRTECNCDQDRVERALALVGETEIDAIISEKGRATVRCDFCRQSYDLSKDDLERIKNRSKAT